MILRIYAIYMVEYHDLRILVGLPGRAAPHHDFGDAPDAALHRDAHGQMGLGIGPGPAGRGRRASVVLRIRGNLPVYESLYIYMFMYDEI